MIDYGEGSSNTYDDIHSSQISNTDEVTYVPPETENEKNYEEREISNGMMKRKCKNVKLSISIRCKIFHV